MKNGFDRLAALYCWMERLSFGQALEQCRLRSLPELTGTRRALLLGDGDGRFAARLLHSAPIAQAHAVDCSAAMLAALQRRCNAAGAGHRVTTHCADLTCGIPSGADGCFDLVTTHFFLDCLWEQDVDALVAQVKPLLTGEARWVVSEFNIPSGPMHVPAWLLVRCLYAAFRLLAGLRVQQLPDHVSIFRRRGFERTRRILLLGGLLVSEVWMRADV